MKLQPPIIVRILEDDYTPMFGDRLSTNILVTTLCGKTKRVQSDGFEYWIKWFNTRYDISPELLGLELPQAA